MLLKVLLIAAGGAAGALLRWALSSAMQSLAGPAFPWGTLLVNVLGCLLIGLLGYAFAGPLVVRETYRAAIVIGVLGGLTTFSTFGWDTLQLVNQGHLGRALLNIALTNVAALGAVWLGYRVGQFMDA